MKTAFKYAAQAAVLITVMLGLMWLLGGRTHSTSATIRVDAKADKVFSFLLDPNLRRTWMSDVESIQSLNGLTDAVGASSEVRTVIDSKSVQVKEEIIELEPEQLLRVRSEIPWATWTTNFALEANQSGTLVHRRTYTQYRNLWRFWSLFLGDPIGDYQQNQLDSLLQAVDAP